MTMTDKWDAEKYKTNFSFVYNYVNGLFRLIDLDKCQFILDFGCYKTNLHSSSMT